METAHDGPATLVVPLMKSPCVENNEPWWKRRYGPRHLQDWYCGLAASNQILKELDGRNATIYVVSGNAFGDTHETKVYLDALPELGIDPSRVTTIREGIDTDTQMEAVYKRCQQGDKVIFIASPAHWLRNLWLTLGRKNVTNRIVWGIPRPYEFATDMAAVFLVPPLDLIGKRHWLTKFVAGRRRKGIL